MKIFTKERVLTPSWDLLQPSVNLLKKYLWPVVYLSFIPALMLNVGLVLMGNDPNNLDTSSTRGQVGLAITLAAAFWSLIAFPAFVYMQTKAIHNIDISISESLKNGLPRLIPLIIMMIIAGVLTVIGFIAFIIPGLLLVRGFYLAPYYVVEQKLGPIAALKKSYSDSKPVTAWIWGVIGVEIVFAIIGGFLGFIPVVGILLSVVVGYLYIFGSALRYGEIAHKLKVSTKSTVES